MTVWNTKGLFCELDGFWSVCVCVCDGRCVVETCRALFSLWAGSFDALPLLSHAWQG